MNNQDRASFLIFSRSVYLFSTFALHFYIWFVILSNKEV